MFLFTAQGFLTIAVIALLLFGPEKLPEMGRIIGRFMAEFKRAQEAVESTIRAEMYQSEDSAAAAAVAPAPAFTASSDEDDDEEEDEE